MKTYFTTILCVLMMPLIYAQMPTVGVQYYDSSAYDGYTLFSPESNFNVYLINNCGEKINEWTFTERPGLTCYLLENGNLLRAGKQSIEIRDWNNNVIWSFLTSSIGINQHHDIEPLPNGNVLCVVTDNYPSTEIINVGRDPNTVDPNFKLDKIVELEPVGLNGANVVWEWKFFDHFIQDFDAGKPNYGVIANHPELIDLNFNNGLTEDYTHVNGIDYNASLDQIIISARHLSEIYIIDHSTTTIEAAGHTGGNSGKGGDILWRWGNPQVYGQGTLTDQKLFQQHDSKWVESGYLDAGKISVFNNDGDGSGNFSSVHLIEPIIVAGNYTMSGGKFDPIDYDWSWNGSVLGTVVDSDRKSGTQSLPNGNFIICDTGQGRFFEVSKAGSILWIYENPAGSQVANQFEAPTGNALFRAEKYPPTYIGFAGQNLTAQGLVEDTNSISQACIASSLSVDDFETNNIAFANPVFNNTLQFDSTISVSLIRIVDINGRLVYETSNFNSDRLNINIEPALYFIQFVFKDYTTTKKMIVK